MSWVLQPSTFHPDSNHLIFWALAWWLMVSHGFWSSWYDQRPQRMNLNHMKASKVILGPNIHMFPLNNPQVGETCTWSFNKLYTWVERVEFRCWPLNGPMMSSAGLFEPRQRNEYCRWVVLPEKRTPMNLLGTLIKLFVLQKKKDGDLGWPLAALINAVQLPFLQSFWFTEIHVDPSMTKWPPPRSPVLAMDWQANDPHPVAHKALKEVYAASVWHRNVGTQLQEMILRYY